MEREETKAVGPGSVAGSVVTSLLLSWIEEGEWWSLMGKCGVAVVQHGVTYAALIQRHISAPQSVPE